MVKKYWAHSRSLKELVELATECGGREVSSHFFICISLGNN